MSVHSPLIADALATLVLLLAVVIVRVLAGRIIRRKVGLATSARRRWHVSLRNVMWIVLSAGLVFIWAHQLRAFALSIAAIAVAIVLATKELILCLSGSVMRTLTKPADVGRMEQAILRRFLGETRHSALSEP